VSSTSRALVWRSESISSKATLEIEDLGAGGGSHNDRRSCLSSKLDSARVPAHACQDVLVVGDRGNQILVFQADLVGFKGAVRRAQLHLCRMGVGLDSLEPWRSAVLTRLWPHVGRRARIRADDGVEIDQVPATDPGRMWFAVLGLA